MLPEIDCFTKWLRRKAPHASTPKRYGNNLERFFTWLHKPPVEVRVADVDSYIEYSQKEGYALTTINRRLAALRSFYHFLILESENTLKNPVILSATLSASASTSPATFKIQSLKSYSP
jgi:site-specific recombinase XerD